MSTTLSRKAGAEEQIGDVKQSILTEAQFQSTHGTTWVLMDGRSVAGSDLATEFGISILPDARGVFLRGKNNGRSDGNGNPAGERAVGFLEGDQMQGHLHNPTATQVASNGTGIQFSFPGTINNSSGVTFTSPTTDGTNGTPRTGNETRPKNITVNTFIKINR